MQSFHSIVVPLNGRENGDYAVCIFLSVEMGETTASCLILSQHKDRRLWLEGECGVNYQPSLLGQHRSLAQANVQFKHGLAICSTNFYGQSVAAVLSEKIVANV